jgi:hypothetical protein
MHIVKICFSLRANKFAYRKRPTISPGLIYFRKRFLMGLYRGGGLIYGWVYTWTIFCVSNKQVRHKQVSHKHSLLRSLFAGPRFSPHVQAAYCSNTFHSNCLANHSLSTRIRNSSRKNLLIPKQRWRRMIKHCVKSPIISYFYFQRSSKECDSNNN